jgi:hypothetical protein
LLRFHVVLSNFFSDCSSAAFRTEAVCSCRFRWRTVGPTIGAKCYKKTHWQWIRNRPVLDATHVPYTDDIASEYEPAFVQTTGGGGDGFHSDSSSSSSSSSGRSGDSGDSGRQAASRASELKKQCDADRCRAAPLAPVLRVRVSRRVQLSDDVLLSDEEAFVIAQCLAVASAVYVLDMQNTQVSVKGAKAIASALGRLPPDCTLAYVVHRSLIPVGVILANRHLADSSSHEVDHHYLKRFFAHLVRISHANTPSSIGNDDDDDDDDAKGDESKQWVTSADVCAKQERLVNMTSIEFVRHVNVALRAEPLSFAQNPLEWIDCVWLFAVLKQNRSIRRLDLRGSTPGIAGCAAIAATLRHMQASSVIEIVDNKKATTTKDLSVALPSSSSNNKEAKSSSFAASSSVAAVLMLEELSLADCKIDVNQFGSLCTQGQLCVRSLNLAGNAFNARAFR